MLDRSRSALADVTTARTATHGCLCPQHVRFSDGRVVGVDDWGLARFGQGDPLRDVGNWVVTSAGTRIGVVLTGRTRTSRAWRNWSRTGWPTGASRRRCGATSSLLCLAEVGRGGAGEGRHHGPRPAHQLARKLFHSDDKRM